MDEWMDELMDAATVVLRYKICRDNDCSYRPQTFRVIDVINVCKRLLLLRKRDYKRSLLVERLLKTKTFIKLYTFVGT